jgi:thiamine-monophosphate kinase
VVALNGGEDFEVLFTIDQSDYEKINKHVDFSVIGHATEVANSIRLVTRAGSAFDIKAQGWPQAH